MDASVLVEALRTWIISVDPARLVLYSAGLLIAALAVKALTTVARNHRTADSGRHGDRRPFRRDANAFAEQGAHLQAGRLYQALGDHDEAIAAYTRGGCHHELGQLFEQLKQWEAAAQAYEAAGEVERAASMLQRVGELRRAGELLKRTGKPFAAAEVLEKARCFAEAAALYEASGHMKRAASLFERAEQWSKAAELFEQEYLHEQRRGQDPHSSHAKATLSALALQAGRLWMRAGRPERAATVFGRQGLASEAADAFVQAGAADKAAEVYRSQGQYERAAEVFDRLGDQFGRDAALAESRLEQGAVREAADLFASARHYLRAAELYEREGQHERAAEMYAASGDQKRAAEGYLAAGCSEKAAAALEQGRQFNDAARLYLTLHQLDRAAALFRQTEDWFEAGRVYHQLGRMDDAIEVLQRIDQQMEDYHDASLLLASIFADQGMLSAAKDRYQKLLMIKHETPEAELEPLYRLAGICEREDDVDGARLFYERILARDFNFRDARDRAAELKQTRSTSTGSGRPAAAAAPAVPPRYTVIKQIGQGGMGVVYRAEDTVLHRIVAYKVLPPSVREQPALLENFLQEARIAASINHPNIVTIYDTGRDPNGDVFISMEFVDGMSLKDLLDKVGPLPLPQFFSIAKQICAGLAHAHGRHIIHRDIKPSNIMLSRDRLVKIMDFGLAKIVSDAIAEKTAVKGTPLYMAPEQILGKEVDHQSDLYALGCTLYRMATGRLPFTKGDLYYHHLHTPPTPPKHLNAKLPAGLNAVILRCLEKDKAKRYQQVGDVLGELEQMKVAA